MGRITEEEKQRLSDSIDAAGLYRITSQEEFEKFIDNSMEGYARNPLFKYVTGDSFDPSIVREILGFSYTVLTKECIAYADSPELNAGALWVPSNLSTESIFDFFKNSASTLKKLGGLSLILRAVRYESRIVGMKNRLTNQNDWYLYNYESCPEYDNDETVIRMLKPVVEYAWTSGRACYMENSIDTRVTPLMKLGFHIVDTITIPKTQIQIHGMMV